MATLESYKLLVQDEIDDESSKTGAVIEQAIKDVYQEILLPTAKFLIEPTEEDVTATAEQRYVTPVNTYSEFKVVLWKDSDGTRFKVLRVMTEDEYYERYVNADSGTPDAFYVKGNVIYFNIPPDNAGTVKISGVKVQTELATSVTSVIPDRFTHVLLKGVLARVKAYERLPESVDYLRMYRSDLEDMITELSNKTRVIRPPHYRRRYGVPV